jgi:hypothetical protein
MKTKVASVGYGLTLILVFLGMLGSIHDVFDIAWLFQHPSDWDIVITGFFEGALWSAAITSVILATIGFFEGIQK